MIKSLTTRLMRLQLNNLPTAMWARLTHKRCWAYETMFPHLTGRLALEIGGPSRVFTRNQLIPVYPLLGSLDICNFASRTLWSRNDDETMYGRKVRKQFTAEATSLPVPNETYDLLLASHVLEHIANPLGALREWHRILRPGGSLLVIVPHPVGTFDHHRPVTSLDHLLQDDLDATGEDDLTHVEEILALHDLAMDPPAGTREEFRQRCLRNFEVRAMHHHVFNPERLVESISLAGLQTTHLSVERPFHIIALASKTAESGPATVSRELDTSAKNLAMLAADADWRLRDPFSHGVNL